MTWLERLLLERELLLWARDGHKPRLWWRDDDARTPGPALDRLLTVADGAPLSLAIIPDGDLPALHERLKAAPTVTVSQHGVDHHNRRNNGDRRSEHPAGSDETMIAERISTARQRMETAGLPPAFYTPPWNAFDATDLAAVRKAGFPAFSAGIYGRPAEGLAHVGAQVDILRWKGDPRFRGRARIFRALRKELRSRRKAGDYDNPIGLLTHHLVHDEPAWEFLDWFVTFARNRFRISSFGDLVGTAAIIASV